MKICPTCGRVLMRPRSKYCSKHCFHTNIAANKRLSLKKKLLYSDPKWKQKTESKRTATTFNHYGVMYPMQVPKIQKKQMQNCFSTKGKMIGGKFLIGYEPLAYKYLLQFYDPTNIISGIDFLDEQEINIEWTDDKLKNHRSFPDFYIPEEQMFVEIKSEYTRKIHDYKIMKAKEVCNKMGYGYCIITVVPKKIFIQESYLG